MCGLMMSVFEIDRSMGTEPSPSSHWMENITMNQDVIDQLPVASCRNKLLQFFILYLSLLLSLSPSLSASSSWRKEKLEQAIYASRLSLSPLALYVADVRACHRWFKMCEIDNKKQLNWFMTMFSCRTDVRFGRKKKCSTQSGAHAHACTHTETGDDALYGLTVVRCAHTRMSDTQYIHVELSAECLGHNSLFCRTLFIYLCIFLARSLFISWVRVCVCVCFGSRSVYTPAHTQRLRQS